MVINVTRSITDIVIHCSDSLFGNAEIINAWHKERGWKEIGYHYIILNGYATTSTSYLSHQNGMIETGRDLNLSGAHVKNANANSVGICLIGKTAFTEQQLISLESILVGLLGSVLCRERNEKIRISGHYEWDKRKTCPNFDVQKFVKDRPRIYRLLK